MEPAEREEKLAELERLRNRVAELENEIQESVPHWQAAEFYTAYYATAGAILGMFGAVASLLFNVVGSWFVEKHPLYLIQVYLTFPLGELAFDVESGLTLVIGCCLYIGTGMLLGVPFHVLLTWTASNKPARVRFAIASVLALSMWFVHFYLILSWLQPLLFGGDWIVREIPWWVGASTHLVYGWTMTLLFPLGEYVPYRRVTEQE